MTTISVPVLSPDIDLGDLSAVNLLVLVAGTVSAPTTIPASGKANTVVLALPAIDGSGGFFVLDTAFAFGSVVHVRPVQAGFSPAVQDEGGNWLNWTAMLKAATAAPHWLRAGG